MNASKHKKKQSSLKNSHFLNSKEKNMPFKLFDFLERFMIGAFLISLIQLEKTGPTGKVLFRRKPKN